MDGVSLPDLKRLWPEDVESRKQHLDKSGKFPIEVIGEMVLKQGKYKGHTIAEAGEDDKYLKWIQCHTKRNDLNWSLLHIYAEKKMVQNNQKKNTDDIEHRLSCVEQRLNVIEEEQLVDSFELVHAKAQKACIVQ